MESNPGFSRAGTSLKNAASILIRRGQAAGRVAVGVYMVALCLVAVGTIRCTSTTSRHPFAHFTWSPAPVTPIPIRSFPLRSPFIERLKADERTEAATVIATTSRGERKWLRYAFAGPGQQSEFVIFSTHGLPPDGTGANGNAIFKQLNSESCNAGYDPIENTTIAETMCTTR